MPSLAAAPVPPETAPALSRNASSIISLSRSTRSATSGALVVPDFGSIRGSHDSSIEKVSPSDRITPRSTTFCSSRMLPGQSYALSCFKVVLDTCRMTLPAFLAYRGMRDSKQGNVVDALAQRGESDREDVEAGEQVPTERAFRHGRGPVP